MRILLAISVCLSVAANVNAQPPDYKAQVERALETFEGKLESDSPEEWEANKALLTFRAGWFIHQINPNIGLVTKTTGNNYRGYSVDLLYDKSNLYNIDIATDEETSDGKRRVKVVWIPRLDPGIASRWAQPTAELAGIGDAKPEPIVVEPEPKPEPKPDEPIKIDVNQELLNRLDEIEKRIAKYEGPWKKLGEFLLKYGGPVAAAFFSALSIGE